MRKTELAQLAVRKLRSITEVNPVVIIVIAILITTILMIALTNLFRDGEGNIQPFHTLMYRIIDIFYSRASDDGRETKRFAADIGHTVKK